MIEELKPYPSYRDSCLAWVGAVPSHWDLAAAKRALRSDNRGAVPVKNSAAQRPMPGYVPAFSASGQDVWLPRATHFGDGIVVSAVGARCGKTFRASEAWALVANTHALAVRSPHVRDYWWYATNDELWWDRAGAAQPFVQVSRTLSRKVPIPPPDEQAAIVRFLNHASRRIDQFIRAKKKLIALLNEQKQAIIYRAVTRGLNPSVTFKESGVPWLSEIPAHWQPTPNRAYLRVRKVLVGAQHREYHLLSLTKRGVIIRDLSANKGKFSSDMGTSQEVRAGDLVFCLFDVPETPRTVGLSSHNGMITGAYTVMECRDPSIGRFLEAFYIAMDDRKLLGPLYSGLRNTIPKDRFLGAKTPIPPAMEREQVLSFIAKETREIQTVIDRTATEITLVQEYRTRLVSDVVTGQLDVRAAAAKLPDLAPDASSGEPGDEDDAAVDEDDTDAE